MAAQRAILHIKKETQSRNFKERNDSNGWNYRLVFHSVDTDGNPKVDSIFVNRFLLAALSPVFAKIFFDTNFSDASKAELVMNGKVFSEFYEFIDCIAVPHNAKESDRKQIDINNIEVLMRFADEYEMEPLKGRCQNFIHAYGNLLKNDNKTDREKFIRFFAAVAKIPNSVSHTLLHKLSRFPLSELNALQTTVEPGLLVVIQQMKLTTYSGLLAPPAPRRRDEPGAGGQCGQCQQTKPQLRSCIDCPMNGGGPRFCLCVACFDRHHIKRVHKMLLSVLCPVCKKPFTLSTNTEPDKCACLF